MEEKKLKELLAEVLNGLTDEQKEQLTACATVQEFMELAGKLGVSLPDELLDAAAGGTACWDPCGSASAAKTDGAPDIPGDSPLGPISRFF